MKHLSFLFVFDFVQVHCNEETPKKNLLNFQGDKKGGPHGRHKALQTTVRTPFFIPLFFGVNFFLTFSFAPSAFPRVIMLQLQHQPHLKLLPH